MVLWEITLGTAYFLGLKRTYRLALKLQRRLIPAKRTKVREFAHRRTRYIFDMALRVHQNIQQRDLEVGRNVGNWILRWLDRMKPSAQIRGDIPKKLPNGGNTQKHLAKSSDRKPSGAHQTSTHASADKKSDGRLFASSLNIRSKPFPTLSTIMRPLNPTSSGTQYRHLSISAPCVPRSSYGRVGFEGVFRKDVMDWMSRN